MAVYQLCVSEDVVTFASAKELYDELDCLLTLFLFGFSVRITLSHLGKKRSVFHEGGSDALLSMKKIAKFLSYSKEDITIELH